MSFISTNAPCTSPDGPASGTTRIVIQRRAPLAPGHEPVERRRFALERARQHRLRALVDALPDDVAQAQVADLLDRQAEVLQERAIDVVAALVAVDVRDRRRHAVHDRAKLRFARGQCILRELQIGDVVADDVFAAHRCRRG